ncbi:MAG: transporter [Ignavibacteria bacterium]|nr:transporter [Ignavibacteria bacterium]
MRFSGIISRFFSLVVGFIIIVSSFDVSCQELEPRAYSNAPIGLNFVLAGYAYSAGGILFDPSIPLKNAAININGPIFAYARSLKFGKMSGKVDVILPYAWLSGSAEFDNQVVSRDVNGFADPKIRMSINFLGSPALSISEFRDYKQNLIIGASLQVSLPMSQYDPERLVNIGTNRYTFKPELGISKTFGSMYVELAAAASFYTTNYDFYNGKTRSQKPIGSIQGHFIYNFGKGMWAAVDGTYYWGGGSTLDGVDGDDIQQNTRAGFTLAYPLTKRQALKLNLSTGVSTRTGSDFDAIILMWQYRWGKGMPK